MSYFKAKMHQIRFRPGLCPGPRWGAYDAPPDHLVGCAAGAPHFPPSTPLASRSRRLWRQNQSIPGSAFSVIRPLLPMFLKCRYHVCRIIVIDISLKTRCFGLHFCRRMFTFIFNHFYTMCPEVTEFGEITQNKDNFAVRGHSRSPILVPIKSSYTTSYYRLILTYLLSCTVSEIWPPKNGVRKLKITIFGLLRLKSPTERFPWDNLRKIFTGFQRMAKIPNGEEKLSKCSTM